MHFHSIMFLEALLHHYTNNYQRQTATEVEAVGHVCRSTNAETVVPSQYRRTKTDWSDTALREINFEDNGEVESAMVVEDDHTS